MIDIIEALPLGTKLYIVGEYSFDVLNLFLLFKSVDEWVWVGILIYQKESSQRIE